MLLQATYSVGLFFDGMFWGHSPSSWSTSKKCCGYGTYLPYACEPGVFKWKTRADGKEDVSIYAPSDLNSPLFSLTGINKFLPLGHFTNTSEWATNPFVRWFFKDVATDIKSVNGDPTIVGHTLNNWDWDNFTGYGASYETIGGSIINTYWPGFWFPIFAATGPAVMRIQFGKY